MTYICGFYAVNNTHCWINGHCAVCNKPYPKVDVVQIAGKLIITDGVGPLRYVDLATNKVHVYPGKGYPYEVNYTIKTIDNN